MLLLLIRNPIKTISKCYDPYPWIWVAKKETWCR